MQSIQAYYDGKIMGFPRFGDIKSVPVLWIRQDWLDKLNLKAPTTIAELMTVADAFKNRDPDGNGKNDTDGIICDGIFGTTGLFHFIMGFHGYASGWLPDSSEKLVYQAIQPNVKSALDSLNEFYKKGLLRQDFGQTSYDDVLAAVLSGRAGIVYGPYWFTLALLQFEMQNPTGKLYAYAFPSVDGKQVVQMVDNPVKFFYVVNKKFQNPEAFFKIVNHKVDFDFGTGERRIAMPTLHYSAESGGENWQHAPINQIIFPDRIIDSWKRQIKALETGDTSGFNPEDLTWFTNMKNYRDGKKENGTPWALNMIFAPESWSSCSVDSKYADNNGIVIDAFYGPTTATMKTRWSSLITMRDETFTKIVTGELPTSAFDTFVADWKRQGGDSITAEVNTWYQENKR
jgi:putative aldouronate transport system substrate-binding protein